MAKRDYGSWDKKELIERVQALEKRRNYGLVWDEEREPENVILQSTNSLPVLIEIPEKTISNVSGVKPHVLIEGDNFHALSVLNYTHKKAIDLIYIDPPYNTGAEDWKYNNNYIDKEDGYRHSKWLSFMNNRLLLAKNLLKPKGVLICAIDENEQERVGLLLEKIFPKHEKACITIVHNPGGTQGDNFSYCHEYAYFIYPAGGRSICKVNRVDEPDIRPLRDVSTGNHLRESAKNCFYPIYVKDEKIIGFGDVCKDSYHPKSVNVQGKKGVMEIYPIDAKGNERKWVFSRQSVEEIKEELNVIFNNRRKVWDIIRTKTRFNYKTVWTDKKYNSNSYGSNMLNRIVDKKFPYPKSIYNVKECLDAVVGDKPEAIVLDYFAGSGTTAHALLEMNRLDNGNRKFILCTNNEGKICEDITYPRIKKIIKGYASNSKMRSLLYDFKFTYRDLQKAPDIIEKIDLLKEQMKEDFDDFEVEFEDNTIRLFGVTAKGKKVKGFGGNMIYYQTTFVPGDPTDQNKELLTKQSVEMLCLREGTFDFVNEHDIWKLYRNKEMHLAILFDQIEIPKFKDMLKTLKTPIRVYVFSLGDDDFAEEFSDMENIKVGSIPEAILRVYRRIFE